jgi:hypothetical protein
MASSTRLAADMARPKLRQCSAPIGAIPEGSALRATTPGNSQANRSTPRPEQCRPDFNSSRLDNAPAQLSSLKTSVSPAQWRMADETQLADACDEHPAKPKAKLFGMESEPPTQASNSLAKALSFP